MINEFFEITRFNLSNITLQYSNINLTRLLEQLIYEFKPILKEKNLKCTLNSTSDIMLHCDANKIQRVFDNLLRNAVIYSYTDTEVAITTELQENTIVITFENFGNPIAEEKLKLIFEQFYRVDTSRNVLLLPLSVIAGRQGKGMVTVINDGKQIQTEVMLGATDGAYIEILSGVNEGDTISSIPPNLDPRSKE